MYGKSYIAGTSKKINNKMNMKPVKKCKFSGKIVPLEIFGFRDT
jgi:hypothetical protein